ncbi:MAG: WXG100 family type VII secretion target [Fimbriimonadaceae bacterium]
MTEIPTWWLVVSALFFFFGFIAMVVAIGLLLKLYYVVSEIQPQIKATAERVEQVSKKVDEVADTVKQTVDDVGGRARGIVGTVEGVVSKLAYAPWMSNVFTALKLLRALQDMWIAQQRANKGPKALPKPAPEAKPKAASDEAKSA